MLCTELFQVVALCDDQNKIFMDKTPPLLLLNEQGQ